MSSNKQHSKNLSREDIQTYLSTQSEQTKRAIEEKSLANDFDTDALDGWSEQNVSITAMHRLDKKFSSTSVNGWMIVALSSIALLIVGSVLLLTEKQPKEEVITAINIEKTDILLPDSVSKLVELPTEEIISVREIKINKPSTRKENKTITKQNNSEEKEHLSVSQLPILRPEFSETNKKISRVEAKEMYLNNLKLIDYRAYRKRPNLTIESVQLSGLPADKEMHENSIKETKNLDLEVTYFDYINKTTALLGKGEYKQALARFNIILSHYPDDLNALFYSGLCYYNLGEYIHSSEMFKVCLTAKFNNFYEEAEWMLAKSYEANGETEKAKAIFQLIKEKGGYYSKRF